MSTPPTAEPATTTKKTTTRTTQDYLEAAYRASRRLLYETDATHGLTMVRSWGELVDSAADLWAALGDVRGSDADAMAQLQAAAQTFHRAQLRGSWPGDGPFHDGLLAAAEIFTRAAALSRAPGEPAADPADPADPAALVAARHQIMHTLYIAAHATAASLQAHLRQPQMRDLDRVDDAAWSRESCRRLQSMEAVAGNYLSGGATHVIDLATPAAGSTDRFPGLGPALAAWDVQAHRSLTALPTPANLQTVCVTQAYIVGSTAAVVDQAAQRGVIDAQHEGLRLQPALTASAHAWEDQHRHWRRLLPRDGRAPDPDLALAATRLRHELRQLTDPRQEANLKSGEPWSDRDVAAALTHHAGVSLDLAYVTADIATDEDSLRVGAWYVAKRIGQARDSAQDAQVPEPRDHHLTAHQVQYNKPVPLPVFIRHELTDAAVATVQTSLVSASSAAALDYSPALPTAAVEPAARTPIYDVFAQDTLWDPPVP